LHESPGAMVAPLVVLAVLSIAGGWIGIPPSLGRFVGVPNYFEAYLDPVLAKAPSAQAASGGEMAGAAALAAPGQAGSAPSSDPSEYLLMLIAVAIAIGGILLARRFYRDGSDLPSRAAASMGALYRLVANKYWVDELYDATVLRLYYAG